MFTDPSVDFWDNCGESSCHFFGGGSCAAVRRDLNTWGGGDKTNKIVSFRKTHGLCIKMLYAS